MKYFFVKLFKISTIGFGFILFLMAFTFVLPTSIQAEDGLGASYSVFFSETGWGNWNSNNARAMRSGNHIGALKLGLYNQKPEQSGTILYQVNLSGYGWLDWVENGVETGRADLRQEPLEAVRVKLNGDLEEQYDIYTRVFQSDNKWTSWVKNGEEAGTSGVGTHIRGIRITVLPKGSEAPGEDDKVDPSRPMIALTFDDGPSAYTPRFLDVLEKYNARATFFVVGNNMNGRNVETAQRAVALGNEIGNHSVTHPQLTRRGASGIRAEIDGVTPKIAGVTGKQPNLFRPPYGAYNHQVLQQLSQTGYVCIMWSVDTLDWKTKSADNTARVVLERAKDGDIVLMHDSQGSSAAAIERIVKGLQDRGYQLVTVSELAMYRGGTSAGHVYSSFH